MATGIGAFIVAIGSLVAFLASTQEGIDKVNRVLTPTKEIFKSLFGVLQDFGKALFDAFSNPKQLIKDLGDLILNNLINRFKAFGKVVSAIGKIVKSGFTDGFGDLGDAVAQGVTGIEDFSQKTKDAVNSVKELGKEAIERGNEIQKLNEEIARSEASLKLETAELQKQIDLEREKRKDTSLSAEERIKAGEEEIRLTTQQRQLEIDLIRAKEERLRLQQSANDTDIEDNKELNDLTAQRLRLEAQLTKDRTRINTTVRNEEKAIQKERIEAIQKESEKRINNLNQELRLYIANNNSKNKTDQEQLKFSEELKEKRLAILEEEFKTGQKKELEYQAEKREILNDFGDEQAEIALKITERELEIQREKIERELLNEEEKLNRLAELERKYAQERLERGKLNEEEFNREINLINEENRQNLAELEAERAEIDKQNRLETERLEFEEFRERRLQELNEQRAFELQEAERLGADKNLINKKFNQLEEELERDLQLQKIALTADALGSIAQLLGENSQAGKAFALAQALFNTYEGISRALSAPTLPQRIAGVSFATATGFGAVRNIASTNVPSFSRGGILDDPNLPGTTTSDSIPARLSKGESVINAKSTSMFAPLLSKINQAGGGVGFAQGGVAGASRIVNQISRDTIDIDKLADKIGEKVGQANRELPSQTLIIEEFDQMKDTSKKIESRANHE